MKILLIDRYRCALPIEQVDFIMMVVIKTLHWEILLRAVFHFMPVNVVI